MHPAIAAQSRRASKRGMRKAPDTHRRAAAGGERSTTTSLHPRRSIFRQASLPDGSPGSGPAGPALGPRTEPSEAGQCGRRRGKGMQQGIPCLQGVPCGMDFDPTSVTFLRGKVTRPQAERPPIPKKLLSEKPIDKIGNWCYNTSNLVDWLVFAVKGGLRDDHRVCSAAAAEFPFWTNVVLPDGAEDRASYGARCGVNGVESQKLSLCSVREVRLRPPVFSSKNSQK